MDLFVLETSKVRHAVFVEFLSKHLVSWSYDTESFTAFMSNTHMTSNKYPANTCRAWSVSLVTPTCNDTVVNKVPWRLF